MEDIENYVRLVLGKANVVSEEGSRLVCEMIKWLLDLIDAYGNKEYILSGDGQGFTFDLDNVHRYLDIKYNSEFYNYKAFRDYILIFVIQIMYSKYGYIIKIQKEGSPVYRFTLFIHKNTKVIKPQTLINITEDMLEDKSILNEFKEVCKIDREECGIENIKNIISMCKDTPKLQKYNWNEEAVKLILNYIQDKNKEREEVTEMKTDDVDKIELKDTRSQIKYSDEYKVDVIYMWIKEWSFEFEKLRDGLYPPKGALKNKIAPKMLDLLNSGKYKYELKAIENMKHYVTEEGLLSNLAQRFGAWVNDYNDKCIKAGVDAPFKPKNRYITKKSINEIRQCGNVTDYINWKLNAENTVVDTNIVEFNGDVKGGVTVPEVNIPFTQVVDEIEPLGVISEPIITTAETNYNTYNVVIKYKYSNKIFSKWNDFLYRASGFNEIQAYLEAVGDLLKTNSDIKNIKINNKATTITQIN